MGLQPRIAPVCTGASQGQVQQGSGEGSEDSGEGLGGFSVEARSGSTGFWRRFWRRWEASVKSPVRVNRVPEKVMEKVPGSTGFAAM